LQAIAFLQELAGDIPFLRARSQATSPVTADRIIPNRLQAGSCLPEIASHLERELD